MVITSPIVRVTLPSGDPSTHSLTSSRRSMASAAQVRPEDASWQLVTAHDSGQMQVRPVSDG